MTDLSPITALGDAAPRQTSFGALTIQENAGLGLASLYLRKGQTAPAPFGMRLPEVSGAVQAGDYGAFWTGPGQWMIELPNRAEADVAALVLAEATEASVSEQTHGFVAFEITSKAGADPLEALLSKLIDIDTAALGPGRVVRTGLEHMTVFVIRRAEDRLAVLGMRSFAGALWHALETTCQRLESKT
ncbi:sarcosine oxidase subunit gamma [Tropicibacter naphthalenivorans]|uniref:Sarcosine oxidase, gamma subunit family n=1 Tax=Tropicibacter naphthalenivorans TaxID=441103 RepID=A0A0P1GJY2_9RHOB|nr:sarcosine oxidase subunit gamma [Tropicibacter naphthalenivorans]CUH82141.1 sarcosine oxidase, gamma subunit family [Tropicibacter naphthalenivorans]SMD10812.1 sarcosine oxidase subunit gamma [Tropicibacter naphthalenivorans]